MELFSPLLYALLSLTLLFIGARIAYHASYRYAVENTLSLLVMVSLTMSASVIIASFLAIPLSYSTGDPKLSLLLAMAIPMSTFVAVVLIARYRRERDNRRMLEELIESGTET